MLRQASQGVLKRSPTGQQYRISRAYARSHQSEFILARLLNDLEKEFQNKKYSQQAFHIAERSKSQALIELLRERDIESTKGIGTIDLQVLLERLAQDNIFILEYYFSENIVYLWCLGGKERTFIMTTLKENGTELASNIISERVLELRSAISNIEYPIEGIHIMARTLCKVLIPPSIRKTLDSGHHIAIIPHNVLHLLPFQVLIYDKGYLLDSFNLSYYAPSTNLFIHTLNNERVESHFVIS
ncbi:MAG: CHAT domain-containing protein [Desulfobacteraceae bacterium]|nr:CHAT domain-containing protein [Desulfobacteraceae bacterium]